MTAGDVTAEVAGRAVRLSSLDRVMWPSGTTKGEVVDYYVHVGDVLLPHLAGRPLTLHRFPGGVTGPHFYQTRCPPHPAWLRTATLSYPRTGKTFEAPVIDDLAGLVWAANLATVEVHPFLGRLPDLGAPTHVVIDLDPGPPAGILDACRVALRVRELLDEAQLTGVPKTTGGKGMHVFVPLGPGATYDATKAWARALARTLAADDPAGVVDVMTRARRAGRVFVDWSQNDAGKSTVAPYSPRAGGAEPAASVPVTWREVEEAVRSGTARGLPRLLRDVPPRLAELGDLSVIPAGKTQMVPTVTLAGPPHRHRP